MTVQNVTINISPPGGGALTQGQPFTTTGTGFGSTGPLLIAWDNFEGGTVGNLITAPTHGAGYNLEDQGAIYSSTSPHTGTRCAMSDPDNNDQLKPLSFNIGAGGQLKYYVGFWGRIVNAPSGVQSQIKFVRVRGEPAPYDANYGPGFYLILSNGWWVDAYNEEPGSQLFEIANGSAVSVDTTWRYFEFRGLQSNPPNTANGSFAFSKDFVQRGSMSNIISRKTSKITSRFLLMEGHTNGNQEPQYADMFVDEVYAQNNWSRVELGNNATYSSATLRVPQRVTSWGNTSVTYECFKGALSTGTVWEYVINDSNTVVQTTQRTIS